MGGAHTQEKYGTGPRFDPISEAKQREAVQYLNRTAFQAPRMFLDPQILRRIEAEGIVGRIRRAQAGVLNSLLSEARLNRMIEYEAVDRGGRTYTVAELLADLRAGVWDELDDGSVRLDVHRRNLQRAYLEAIERTLVPPEPAQPAGGGEGPSGQPQPYQSDLRPILRGHLVELDRLVQEATPKAGDGMTRLHLRDLHMEIEKLLDVKKE